MNQSRGLQIIESVTGARNAIQMNRLNSIYHDLGYRIDCACNCVVQNLKNQQAASERGVNS